MANKRGLSPVIATVLLVLITIAAVALIASFIIPFVRDNLADSTSCVSYMDYFKFDEKSNYNCFDTAGELYGLTVKSSVDKTLAEGISGFSVAFIKTGESQSLTIIHGENTSELSGGIRMLNSSLSKLSVPRAGESRTYVYNSSGFGGYESVEIYPVLNNKKTCGKTDSIKFAKCSSVSLILK